MKPSTVEKARLLPKRPPNLKERRQKFIIITLKINLFLYVSCSHPVGQLNENPVHKYELLVFNIDEIELLVFIGVENEQLVFNGIENAHLLYPLNSPFRINIWGGAECPLPVLSQTRIFGPPPPLPPLSDRFCKKSEKIRIDSEWPETARNRKKKFAPW